MNKDIYYKIIFTVIVSVMLTCAGMVTVVISTLESLKYARLYDVQDGKGEMRVTLFFGPFAYNIDVEAKELSMK